MKYTLTPEGRKYSAFLRKYIWKYVHLYNFFIRNVFFVFFLKENRFVESSSKELNEVRMRALENSDISDHMELLFTESLSMNPKLIVELGVRSGRSTFVFERVAKVCDAFLLSVDIEPQLAASSWSKWNFIQEDDLTLADRFKDWCAAQGIDSKIDVLFIDTNHEYTHTKREIAKWFPILSPNAKVFFHDANVKMLYKRRNGTIGKAYNDDRDIMRAIEEYLGTHFNEKEDFVDFKDSWLVRHYAICNGMTILQKITAASQE